MSDIIVYKFNQNQVRTKIIAGEPWFCLADCATALGIKNAATSVKLSEKGVGKTYILTAGGRQEVTIINEPNLYRLIFRSNKPQAQAFADWVYNEVLPQIRKTGSYGVPVLDKTDIRSALYDYFGEVMLNEEMLPKWRVMFQRWMKDVIFSEDYFEALKKLIIPWVKDAAAEMLGKSIDAYIKAEMDERVKYFVGFVFKNYPKMSQKMKEYLITYGIVNYGKFSEYSREKDFKGICDTVSRQESKDPTVRYAA